MDLGGFAINSTIKLATGRLIPRIGYGTYQLKGDDCVGGVKAALKHGYRHIDTASIYKNEEEIQKVLNESEVKRQELFITSKISPKEQGFKEAKEACGRILDKLGCKYLDLILIHWPGASKLDEASKKHQTIRLESWKALIELQQEGKVRDIGVSNFLQHHLKHLAKNTEIKPVVNQFEIHPLLWEGSTIKYCRENDIAIEAYSPLARQSEKLFKNKLMGDIASKYKKTIAQISLRWCLQNNFIILPKSKTEARILENISIFDFQLNEEEMKNIQLLSKEKVRTCWNPHCIKY